MSSTSPFTVTIYHNPGCSTSRKVLDLIRAAGLQPTVVDYLKTPYSREQLLALSAACGVGLSGLLRRKGDLYKSLNPDPAALSDAALLDLMLAHPVLVERPIVVSPLGARLCRPIERVHELLP